MFYFIQFIVTAKRVKMSDSQSLLIKYPHLRTLLKENNEKKKEDIAPPRVRRPRDPQPAPAARVSAEQLCADSANADNDDWLCFVIKETEREQMGELKRWLELNKPSKVRRSSGVGWISVMTSKVDEGEKEDVDLDDAKAEWESCVEERTMETVNSLAVKYNDTAGKWLLHISSEYVDKVWYRLALALMRGDLSPPVMSIKVSPKSEEENSHVIVVHNANYRDTEQVMRAEHLLRSVGVRGDLHYKPDIFSNLGIYRNNVWGFRPSIYISKTTKANTVSKITVTGTGI